MLVQVVKSKIHRVIVTGADLNYVGSISICPSLMGRADMLEYEFVHVNNLSNGDHWETYVIPGNFGEITLNGAAARKVAVGDVLILIVYGFLELEEAKKFKPQLVFPNEKDNTLT